ncbi:hypothetical protein [Wenyingzhuangia sp. IMCC45467]
MKQKIEIKVFNFFVESNDFNGIKLRRLSSELGINYIECIDLIKELVSENKISIQSSTNPHIIGFQHFPIKNQLIVLEEAKKIKEIKQTLGTFTFTREDTDTPICLYPTPDYLKENRNLDDYENAIYSKKLALAEPQLKPFFFEIEVLERYSTDPRFNFIFEDYSGSINCNYDENGVQILREEDKVFIKTFGLGFDSNKNRLAVVYLRYLSDLTPQHQIYWSTREVKGNCKVLEEYYNNIINGSWSFSHSIFSALIGELTCLNMLSEKAFGQNIFRKNFDNNNRPKEFTFFFTPTLKNYNDFILLLDKMISENINSNFFKDKIELYNYHKVEDGVVERKYKNTLNLFEEWLTNMFSTNDNRNLTEIFTPLKKVRRERQNPAHRISENNYDKKYIELQKTIVQNTYNSIRHLRHIFQQHPKAKDVKIEKWLDEGSIKTF